MNDEDFDLEKFVDLFDTAMSSDNPTVKRAFKNLMLVAALADSENENKNGPLRDLVDKVRSLENRISAVEWRNNVGIGGAIGAGGINPAVWTTTSTPTGTSGLSGTYTFNSPATSASTANYMASTNYDNLYDNLQSKN